MQPLVTQPDSQMLCAQQHLVKAYSNLLKGILAKGP